MKRLASFSLLAVVAFSSFAISQDNTAPASAQPPAQAPAPAHEQAAISPSFSVDSIVFSTGIESRVPVGVNSEFPWDVGGVSCWIRVSSSHAPVPVKFQWYKNDEMVLEWMYSLISESGRLWSTKAVSTGKWKVEILDGAKNVVKTATFEVKERS
jgi:hypothetical protein